MRTSAAITACLLLCATALAARAEQLIELTHPGEPSAAVGQAAAFFAEQVNTRLAGRVRVEVSPDSAPSDPEETVKALNAGDARAGLVTITPVSRFATLAPQLRVFELPLLFDGLGEVHALLDSDLGGRLFASLESAGVRGLAVWDGEMTVFSVNGPRPLRESPADFAGKRFCLAAEGVRAATVRALGATVEEPVGGDVYQALAEKTLDGCSGPWSRIFANGYQEVQDWISVSNHSYLGYMVATGAEFWKGLPDDVRGQLGTILGEATAKSRELAAESEKEYRARIEESGRAAVLGLTSDERETWRAATAEVAAQYGAEIGAELVTEVRTLLGR
jgi:C4-dicarboxylate-binding protein DctP